MSRLRLGAHAAVALTAAAVLLIGAFATVALVANDHGEGNGGGNSGDVGVFNACIGQTRFLALVRHGRRNGIIETIADPARGTVVGEVAAGRAHTTLGGAAAGIGRYVMSTATPLGRDATAIERCWDRFSPISP